MSKRTRSDISNIAVRMLLQEESSKYKAHTNKQIFEILGKKCIYCESETDITIDHLVPINKKDCGLHIAGNLVPACRECNHEKSGKSWRFFANSAATERIEAFLKTYEQDVNYRGIREKAEIVYKQSGNMVVELINSQID